MTRRIKEPLRSLVAVAVAVLTAGGATAQPAAPAAPALAASAAPPARVAAAATPADEAGPPHPALGRAEGMLMLDYQVVPVPNEPSLDLLGLSALTRVNDWMHVGFGVLAPMVKGEYGGFMAFDVIAHAQHRIWGDLFVDGGVALGGGGGGKSKEQSRVLSGTGGFAKAYAGLGYDFKDFSVAANVATMRFRQAAIDSTQLNVVLQVPFGYTVGDYASAGQPLSAADGRALAATSAESVWTFGLDNLLQIDPKGSNTSTIRLIDLQYAYYLTPSTFWYAALGVGYQGLRLYNQLLGGLGYRWRATPSLDLVAQLGVGSGGWAPDRIDTGAGLLVYPKLSAEYAISRHFGLALTAGYLAAPTGSSRNATVGAALSYHLLPQRGGVAADGGADGGFFRGYRVSLLEQTETGVEVGGIARPKIGMLTGQLDAIVDDHVYVPLQVSVAYDAYLGYPGYGELLAGVGLQTAYRKGDRFQFFGQLLAGTNVHGAVVKPGVGLNVGLTDALALYALAGRTLSTASSHVKFSADYAGLGLSYRFSVPGW